MGKLKQAKEKVRIQMITVNNLNRLVRLHTKSMKDQTTDQSIIDFHCALTRQARDELRYLKQLEMKRDYIQQSKNDNYAKEV